MSDGGWDFGFCRIGLAASAVGFESGLYPRGIGKTIERGSVGGFLKEAPKPPRTFPDYFHERRLVPGSMASLPPDTETAESVGAAGG